MPSVSLAVKMRSTTFSGRTDEEPELLQVTLVPINAAGKVTNIILLNKQNQKIVSYLQNLLHDHIAGSKLILEIEVAVTSN